MLLNVVCFLSLDEHVISIINFWAHKQLLARAGIPFLYFQCKLVHVLFLISH